MLSILAGVLLATGMTCLAGCGDACSPDCEGKECGPDGCGGVCGTCSENRICTSDGICDCAVRCADGNCWAPGTNCATLGKCEQDTSCHACAGTDLPFCCNGLYVCCEATHPYACTDRVCYEHPEYCPAELCEDVPPDSCP